ncbi:MAG: ribonuclease P protein component [Xanthomonadaceae bacterium]|jgi:ribonuclease P protein component|nr:ribonuclease P protein component [Xanthomonadaceae bacterium]
MNQNPRARFPRDARVRFRAEYTRVFEQGRRITDPLMSLHWLSDARPPRLGLAVSRKVDKRAVGRNRIKRIFREKTRHLRPQLAGGDYVIVARPAAAGASVQQLISVYLRLLQRIGALPIPPKDGTMQPASVSHSSSGSVPEPFSG